MNAVVPIRADNAANVDAYRASTDAAEICKGIVVATATTIQGRKYVNVEGWQAIAIAHGCAASARDVEKVEGGVRAIGEIRRMSDGAIIAQAEGFVGEDEDTWYGGTNKWGKVMPKRSDYAIRAMAQTRAISRACRSAFAHVVVMMNAGLATTPAEEVPEGGFDDAPAKTAERTVEAPVKAVVRDAVRLISEDQRRTLMSYGQAAGMTTPELLKKCKIRQGGQLSDLPADKFESVKKWLTDKMGGDPPAEKPAANPQASDLIDDDIPY